MKLISCIEKYIQLRPNLPSEVGFIPTMGALHKGHLSLVKQSLSENELTVVSIFVNPTQFNNSEDLTSYPNTLQEDLKSLEEMGVDIVLTPTFDELYPDNYNYKVSEEKFSPLLCGAHRPGHFDGVLTIVLKLLNIVQAKKAYFGEKDFQQLKLIKSMADAFFIPTKIIAMPTVREESGLAMSSRNLRLTPEELAIAPQLYKTVLGSSSITEAKVNLEELGFKVDYLEEHFNRRFVAATLGKVRLIDNVEL